MFRVIQDRTIRKGFKIEIKKLLLKDSNRVLKETQ